MLVWGTAVAAEANSYLQRKQLQMQLQQLQLQMQVQVQQAAYAAQPKHWWLATLCGQDPQRQQQQQQGQGPQV